MSIGFDLLSGAPKKLWVSHRSLFSSASETLSTFCMPSWSHSETRNQSSPEFSMPLRSKRTCCGILCFEDHLRKQYSFSILGHRGFRILGFS
ncbi:hypothetical protein TorRG33x02_097380 [Trema orientale]|uniref:Uncharacterized protein n=1 Tax=Trema orientale TaxID=63057 RepID=A0A2P5F9M3_TREOI|nr:hypothetical protein TorRG33x02_097380 [Trema orientale]